MSSKMATLVAFLLCSKTIFQIFHITEASSHWIVTENGKIQGQADSIFNLRRPYDLVALMKQEERAETLQSLKKELLTRKEEIDKNEDKDTGLEQRFYKTDHDCRIAGKPLPEFDLYISTVLPLENKGIKPEEHVDFNAVPSPSPMAPVCTGNGKLDFSMHAFEHLEGMKNRQNLSGSAELGLKNAITHRSNVDDYGHLVYEAMLKEESSWVLFNMAAFYWRIKGDPYQAIECLRRALHHSPRMQKDVALISLANILHRAHYSNEAAIVVHAALDVSKELNVNHFTLGNIYAVLAEYNKSVICFDNTLKIQRDFEAAAKRKHAVLCHAKLEAALEAQHRSLQRTLDDLRDYQDRHELYQAAQDRLLAEQAVQDVKFEQRVAFEEMRARRDEAGLVYGEHCWQEQVGPGEEEYVLRCGWGLRQPIFKDEDFLNSWNPANTKEGNGPSTFPTEPFSAQTDYMRPVRPPRYNMKMQMLPEMAVKMPYKAKEWPSKEECDTYVQKFPAWNEFPTTYMSAENKGFEVKALLADAQGLKKGVQHPLPWYPPVCVTLADIPEGARAYDHIPSVRDRTKIPLRLYDLTMKETLLAYVEAKGTDMTEEEVGQRILTALKKKIEPSWVLYNIAGLYWRVIGNNYHAIECIRRSVFFAPDQYKDVPLLNLANVLYKWGRVDDAVTVMRDAVSINDLEPETHFFLGNLLAAKGNLSGAIFHYEEALAQNAVHKEGFNSLRIIKCYQKYHRSAQSAAPKETPAAPTQPACIQEMLPGGCPKPQGNPNIKNLDQRNIICKNELGKESCVVETQSTACDNCKQACTVVTQNQVEGVPPPHPGGPQCGGPTDKQIHCTGEHCVDEHFNEKLEEISEYYRDKGMCDGEDCHKFMIQPNNGYKPHTRLEIVNGVLHQRLLFGKPEDIDPESKECIIYADGQKTAGCDDDKYRLFNIDDTHAKLLADNHDKLLDLINQQKQHLATLVELKSQQDDNSNINQELDDDGEDEDVDVDVDEDEDDENYNKEDDDNSSAAEAAGTIADDEGIQYLEDTLDDFLRDTYSDEEIIKLNPDPVRHIKKYFPQDLPSYKECKESYQKVDFKQFMSTWVSVTIKGVEVRDYVDFDSMQQGELQEPVCDTSLVPAGSLAIDHLPQLADPSALDYGAEMGLTNILQKLGGDDESVAMVGNRISIALKEDPTSWVLTNLAALYWRVEGNGQFAIDCLRVNYKFSPDGSRDVGLLSLANVLHRAGEFDAALVVVNMALQMAPELVALHFTAANIYAAKVAKRGVSPLEVDWTKSMAFYQSTLDLQPSFMSAKQRLNAIMCEKVLSNPHIYKNLRKKNPRDNILYHLKGVNKPKDY